MAGANQEMMLMFIGELYVQLRLNEMRQEELEKKVEELNTKLKEKEAKQ